MTEASAMDAGLWARARGGDAGARERLAGLAHEVAERELRVRRAPRADLEDLVQESVRSTLACLRSGGPEPKELRAFLKFRAWGVLSDHRKRLRAAMVTIQSEEIVEAEARGAAPDASLRLAQLRDALHDCRGRLPEEQQVVLLLRYESRLQTEEIASRLGVHRNTINVRVFRALTAVRECMRRKGFQAGDLG